MAACYKNYFKKELVNFYWTTTVQLKFYLNLTFQFEKNYDIIVIIVPILNKKLNLHKLAAYC